jgi:hypothetical protein
MLHRFSLLRGSAHNSFRITFKVSPFRQKTSPTPAKFQRPSQFRKTYIFCAVGGLIVASSTSDTDDMAPLELAGRPGNLTDEQKVKLKEMWSTAFKVFGVPVASATESETDVETVNEVPRTNTEPSDTKKGGGKLTSLFKKKKDKEATPSPRPSTTDLPADVSKLSIADGDDKYSQTKDFKEAIATSTPQEIRDTFWQMVKADHPDALFLRFLRARKWDVNKAIVMLVATMRWRSKDLDVFPISRIGLTIG